MSSTQRRLPPPWLFGITALPYGVYGGYQHGHALRFAERRSARPVSAVSSRCGSHSALNPSAASGSLTVTVTPLRNSICRSFSQSASFAARKRFSHSEAQTRVYKLCTCRGRQTPQSLRSTNARKRNREKIRATANRKRGCDQEIASRGRTRGAAGPRSRSRLSRRQP